MWIIAEVAQAHDGSLGAAHAYVDAIAKAGADAVKFQTHIASAESTRREPWRVKFSLQDATRFDYWQRTGFSEEQWAGLRRHAAACGLRFLSSPFSLEAAELLQRVGISAWKIASGETSHAALLDFVAGSGLPVLVSTGMSPLAEIDRMVARLRGRVADLTLLQCTTAYPCPPEKVGLNLLGEFRARYGVKVGLSDHSGSIYAGLAAVALGAEALEVHVTFSRECFGPDVPASLTTRELAQLVEGARAIEKMLAHPVDKDALAGEAAPARAIFQKSVVARVPLAAGSVLREADLALKKPGAGLGPERIPELVGRRLTRALAADEAISEADLVAPAEVGV
ncbi:MAG TPA: N-acetylneuraminate synthase family protein [Bryobacteraceae bacterium]|jgi:N-acetylneuraminate synthase